MLGRLKDWRRVAPRYHRCPKVFLSAIALAALVGYWLRALRLVSRIAPKILQGLTTIAAPRRIEAAIGNVKDAIPRSSRTNGRH